MSSDRPSKPAVPLRLPPFVRETPEGLVLTVKARPRASRNKLGEPVGSEWKIWVTAPPADSAANEAVVELLSVELDWPRFRVELVHGGTNRHKTILLRGMTAAQFMAAAAR